MLAGRGRTQDVHVCLISNQIAAWGKIGGFGTATRAIGRGLAERGVQVSAVVPRRAKEGQGRVESLDGITVYGTSTPETLFSGGVFRQIGADIYHSQEPTVASFLAQRAAPDAVHVVTCRDPRGLPEHLVELRHTNYKRRLIAPATWYYEASPWCKRAVRNADQVFMPAPGVLVPRIERLYGSGVHPVFVPSPVDVPDHALMKASDPLALFVGRWDHRKRIERFFDLAAVFPEVRFVAVGKAHDSAYDRELRATYAHLPNIEMPGFIPRFGEGGLTRLYEQAWVLVNTSAREGLPYTFIEACAWDCAVLSCLDPDGFASRFGYHVADESQAGFESGMRWLLEDDRWRELGRRGGEYVRSVFSEKSSIDAHLGRYEALLSARVRTRASRLRP
jgi:glycosyltransferase involved in cell wall biosynthesis